MLLFTLMFWKAKMKMYSHAFAIVSDSAYFSGLWALLNSIHAYYENEIRVFVFGNRLTAEQRSRIESHVLRDAITLFDDARVSVHPPVGIWEAKQQTFDFLMGQARCVCLLDADLVLLSRLDDVFSLAEGGKIVSSRDGVRPVRISEEYRCYSEKVVGMTWPYFNSGFLCLDIVKHWDLAALWSFSSRFAAYSPDGGSPLKLNGYGDQGTLNAIAAMLGKEEYLHIFDQELWCNSGMPSHFSALEVVERDGPRLTVRHRVTQHRQRMLHCSGPKWWTNEGREHFGKLSCTLDCFRHFSTHQFEAK
jgi:hypothetical protein